MRTIATASYESGADGGNTARGCSQEQYDVEQQRTEHFPTWASSLDVSPIPLRRTADKDFLPGVLSYSFEEDKLTLLSTIRVRLGTNPALTWDGSLVPRPFLRSRHGL
ncbi:MAG: hypothetical protein JSU80_03325 [Deltaproteobacteria bacterium]|nr:MAG: hypothetical protein JSU80_03325 [Deltaproteobacteria bacterium]